MFFVSFKSDPELGFCPSKVTRSVHNVLCRDNARLLSICARQKKRDYSLSSKNSPLTWKTKIKHFSNYRLSSVRKKELHFLIRFQLGCLSETSVMHLLSLNDHGCIGLECDAIVRKFFVFTLNAFRFCCQSNVDLQVPPFLPYNDVETSQPILSSSTIINRQIDRHPHNVTNSSLHYLTT